MLYFYEYYEIHMKGTISSNTLLAVGGFDFHSLNINVMFGQSIYGVVDSLFDKPLARHLDKRPSILTLKSKKLLV